MMDPLEKAVENAHFVRVALRKYAALTGALQDTTKECTIALNGARELVEEMHPNHREHYRNLVARLETVIDRANAALRAVGIKTGEDHD